MRSDSTNRSRRQKVSVLLPFHCERELLARAVESVRAQTQPDWQLVLVANNADAETLRIAHELAAGENKIQLVEEKIPGIAFALNTGLAHCTGEYIARLDADDRMPRDRLQLQSEYLDQHGDTGLVSGRVNFITDAGHGYDHYVAQINSWITHDTMFRYRFVESPVAHPSVMFRRVLIEKYGNYATHEVPEDYELWLRFFSHGVRFAKIGEGVLDWYDSPGRLSRTHQNYARRAFDRARMQYLTELLPSLTRGRPLWICGGKYARKKATQLSASGIAVTGIVDLVPKKLHTMRSMTYAELPPAGNIFLVSFVSNRDGYRIVEKRLTEMGYQAERDFLLAA